MQPAHPNTARAREPDGRPQGAARAARAARQSPCLTPPIMRCSKCAWPLKSAVEVRYELCCLNWASTGPAGTIKGPAGPYRGQVNQPCDSTASPLADYQPGGFKFFLVERATAYGAIETSPRRADRKSTRAAGTGPLD